MFFINNLFKYEPFSLEKKKRDVIFETSINKLTIHHYNNSKFYRKILNFFKYHPKKTYKLKDIPFLPIKLFKTFELISVKQAKIVKILNSSGTTGDQPAKIFLDKENAYNQSVVLKKIIHTILGKERLPMLIVDQNPKLSNRAIFKAREAAIYGFQIFGKNHTFLLNSQGKLDLNLLKIFLQKYQNQKFFIFGFTSVIYLNLIKKLSLSKHKFNFKNGILLHGGGWKKIENMKVSEKLFNLDLKKMFGLKNIYNYYGMVEQTGSIFLKCKECSCFISSIFSEVLIRDKHLNLVKDGTKGFIQLLSLLPKSYPGHSILTEDIGSIVKDNHCDCNFKGTRFKVHGRAKEVELRGCSDV